MFDNINNISLYNYQVQLENIVKAICEISFDIGEQIHDVMDKEPGQKGFDIEDLFKEEFLREISVRPEALVDRTKGQDVIPGYTKDEFFAIIAEYYSRELVHIELFLKGLDGSDVLFLDKVKGFFIGIGDKPKERLMPALKGAKILDHLIQNLKNDKIKKSLEKIGLFENDIFYRNSINASKMSVQPILPFIPVDMLDGEHVEFKLVDIDDYYVNVRSYKKLGAELPDVEEFYICSAKHDNSELGLLVGDDVLLFTNADLLNYIKPDKFPDYFWLLLTKSYTKPAPRQSAGLLNDPALDEFVKLRVDKDLNNLLSHLKNNFYIAQPDIIEGKFAQFFNSVVSFDKLQYLDSYQFLMSPNFEEETALGVYSTEKINKSYNLLHWINHKGASEISHFRTQVPTTAKKMLISTLKPAICYYYLEKYFEDLVESILLSKNVKHIANRNFYDGDVFAEVDFLVYTGTKLIYIETKTKLTKNYIDDYLKRASSMLRKVKPMLEKGVDVEFVILGAYSDPSVEDYRYFVDVSTDKNEDGYNQPREGLASKPYYFNVPIPDQKGQNILCIAEPHYDKLENLIDEICQ